MFDVKCVSGASAVRARQRLITGFRSTRASPGWISRRGRVPRMTGSSDAPGARRGCPMRGPRPALGEVAGLRPDAGFRCPRCCPLRSPPSWPCMPLPVRLAVRLPFSRCPRGHEGYSASRSAPCRPSRCPSRRPPRAGHRARAHPARPNSRLTQKPTASPRVFPVTLDHPECATCTSTGKSLRDGRDHAFRNPLESRAHVPQTR